MVFAFANIFNTYALHSTHPTMFTTVISSTRSSVLRASLTNARTFHTSPVAAKTVTEKVSEVADTVSYYRTYATTVD